LIQPVRVVLEKGLAEAIDAPQRRTEIVRHGIAECLEIPVLPLELIYQRGSQIRKRPGRAGFGCFKLLVEQLFANAPILVLVLLAAYLGAHSGLEDLELARL